MKFIITLITIFGTLTCVNAQWQVGPKASIGFITQKASAIPVMPTTDYLTYEMAFVGSSTVKSIGFMAYNDLGPVFLQTEFMATSYDLDFSIATYKNINSPDLYKTQYYMIEIPFAAGVQIKNFKVGLGPVFEINVDKKSDLSTMDNYIDSAQKTEFGFHSLIGYRKGIMHFDFKYVYKFSSIVDDFALGNDQLMYNKSANRFSISVGVAF